MRMLLSLLALLLATPAAAQLSPAQLAQAGAHPAADARLPAALPFVDQDGRRTTLGQVAGARPLVLLFADYTCRHICGPGLALTAGALHDSGLVAGRDYALAVVGLDAKDPVSAARAFAGRIADADVGRATRLLTGTPPAVAAAERALGYVAVYDAGADQFAHDASVYVFARDGRLTTLVPELGLRPEPLRAAIVNGAAPPETLTTRIARLCYGLASAHGRYGGAVATALKGLAALTLVALGAFLLTRRSARA